MTHAALPKRTGRTWALGRAWLDPKDVTDLILGCGLTGGEQGWNMGRNLAVLLGHGHLPGTTITRHCSSSLQTTRMAFHAIKVGDGDAYISAGVETVSRFGKGKQRPHRGPGPAQRAVR